MPLSPLFALRNTSLTTFQCVATSTTGPYATPTATIFPDQPSSSSPPTSTSSGSGSCTATSVPVTFIVTETTTYGENVFLTGNTTDLSTWSTTAGIPLSAGQYTASNPIWTVVKNLPQAEAIEYKYYKVESSGSVVWEAGSNRVFKVGGACDGTESRTDTWQT